LKVRRFIVFSLSISPDYCQFGSSPAAQIEDLTPVLETATAIIPNAAVRHKPIFGAGTGTCLLRIVLCRPQNQSVLPFETAWQKFSHKIHRSLNSHLN